MEALKARHSKPPVNSRTLISVFFTTHFFHSSTIFFFSPSRSSRSSPSHRQEALVLKALVLGEEERGQSQYQVMCFVTKFQKGDFITSDAMAKLRQVGEVRIDLFLLAFCRSF